MVIEGFKILFLGEEAYDHFFEPCVIQALCTLYFVFPFIGQMFRSMKRFDALDTIITPFSSMNQAVYFQSSSKAKCLIASSACVIFNHCGLACELSSTPPDGISYCIQHNCPAFFHYVSACDPLGGGFA